MAAQTRTGAIVSPGPLKRFLEAHRHPVAIALLLGGLGIGLAIYLTASPPPDTLLPESKQYLREMETYGGTANVLATELRVWFDGLWQGPTLGITIACLSAVLALIVFVALTPLEEGGDGE